MENAPQHNNDADIDDTTITSFIAKLKVARATLSSRNRLQDAIKLLETEKNKYETLYLSEVKKSTDAIREKVHSFAEKERYEHLLAKYNALKQNNDILIVQKQKLEEEYNTFKNEAEAKKEDALELRDCIFVIKEQEFRDETAAQEAKFATEKNKIEAHYKSLLNQNNEKLKQALSTNSNLQGEIMAMKVHANGNRSGFQDPELISCKDRLRNADAKISQLEKELNNVYAQLLHDSVPQHSSTNNILPGSIFNISDDDVIIPGSFEADNNAVEEESPPTTEEYEHENIDNSYITDNKDTVKKDCPSKDWKNFSRLPAHVLATLSDQNRPNKQYKYVKPAEDDDQQIVDAPIAPKEFVPQRTSSPLESIPDDDSSLNESINEYINEEMRLSRKTSGKTLNIISNIDFNMPSTSKASTPYKRRRLMTMTDLNNCNHSQE